MTARVIVERAEGSGVMVLLPTGDIVKANSVKSAERKISTWNKRNIPSSGVLVTTIVWRDGLVPTLLGKG